MNRMNTTNDRILLVEDDPRLAEMLTEYLSQSGFRVTHAPNGCLLYTSPSPRDRG